MARLDVIPRDLQVGDRVQRPYGPADYKQGWFRVVEVKKVRRSERTEYYVRVSLDDVKVPRGQEPVWEQDGSVRLDPNRERNHYYASPHTVQRVIREGA